MDKANKLKSYTFISILIAFFLCGCDFLDTDTQKVVGYLYVNYAQSASNGYVLVVMDGSGQNDNISEDYIQTLTGDDTVLLIKAIDRNDGSLRKFYELKHNKGQTPFSLRGINEGEYRKQLENIDNKYYFVAKTK